MKKGAWSRSESGDALVGVWHWGVGQRPDGQLGPIGFPEFAKDPVEVLFDGALGEVQLVRNLFIEFGLRDKTDNLFLAKTEAGVQYFLADGCALTAARTDTASAFASKIGSTTKTTAQFVSCSEVKSLYHAVLPQYRFGSRF